MNADGAAGAPRAACVALALGLAALTLPFDPRWLDFEATRRALACVVAAILLAASEWRRAQPGVRNRVFVPAAMALVGWVGMRGAGAINGGEGLLRIGYWASLGVGVLVGMAFTRRQLAVTVLPTGLAVAAYGIAQAFGLEWPAGYGHSGEAVSTLGNRNVAAECEVLAFACAAFLLATAPRVWLAGIALSIAALAIGANGTRTGLVSATVVIGLAWLGAAEPLRRARRAGLLAATALLALGVLARSGASEAVPLVPGANQATSSTIALRVAVWKGVLATIGDAPILGCGAGQLRFAYPLHRRQDEIEASTFGRRFPTLVDSAHCDPLEVTAELGIVGALLAIAFLVAVLRGSGARSADLLPLVAFATHALVRAPLGNAPAAFVAALWLGSLASNGEARPRPAWQAPIARVVGLALAAYAVWLTAGPLLAAQDVAAWLRTGDATRLDAAIRRHDSEPRYRSLRIQELCGGFEANSTTLARSGPAEYSACSADLDALQRLDPFNTESLLLLAQLAHGAGEHAMASAAVARVLALDRREPRAQKLAAAFLVGEGKHREAAATLYADPHPRLRLQLARTFADFASATDGTARALFTRESAFVRAVDALIADPASSSARDSADEFGRLASADDPRVRVVLARALLAAGKAEATDRLAPPRLELGRAERALLAPLLEALRIRPVWAAAATR